MNVLLILLPVSLVGLITWIAVGMRRRSVENFTLAAGASFYAHLLTIVAVTMALLGVALGVKVLIAFFNLAYSYSNPVSAFSSGACPAGLPAAACPPVPPVDLTPQRTDDIALAITLFAVGAVLLVVHRLLARSARRFPGGLPAWVQRGTLLGFVVLYASAAIFSLVAAVHGIVSYVITPAGNTTAGTSPATPFGDLVGAAAAFIPAWVVALVMLALRLRAAKPVPPPVSAVGASVQPGEAGS